MELYIDFGYLRRQVLFLTIIGSQQLDIQLPLPFDQCAYLIHHLRIPAIKDIISRTDLNHDSQTLKVLLSRIIDQAGRNHSLEGGKHIGSNEKASGLGLGFNHSQDTQTAERFTHNDSADAKDPSQFLFGR